MSDQQYADNIIPIYKKYAIEWDKVRSQHFYEQAWLEQFLNLIPDQSSILDLGCGAGIPTAQYFSAKKCQITGIDSSAAMLEISRNRFPEHNWLEADMRQLDLKQSFNGIIAWDSFFHLTHNDQRAMFHIFKKHAKTGTALMLTTGPSHGTALGEMQGEVLYHASLDPDEYKNLFETFGFRVVNMRFEDPDCARHTIWLAQLM